MNNLTNFVTHDSSEKVPHEFYELSFNTKVVWTGLFLLITVVGLIGNCIIVWVVATNKEMRTATNIYLVNIAISDALVAAVVNPLVSVRLVHGNWPFGYSMCIVNEFIGALNICVSVLTLSMISIDRYRALMDPFRERMKKYKIILIIAAIWLLSAGVSAPHWMHVTTSGYATTAGVKWMCTQIWENNILKCVYRAGFTCVTYLLPLSCLSYCYYGMAQKLWKNKIVMDEIQTNMKRVEKRSINLMIFVVATFGVCWLPLHLMFIINAFTEITPISGYNYVLVFWLAMSNSMYNPFIYYWLNDKWRAGFKIVFNQIPGVMLKFICCIRRVCVYICLFFITLIVLICIIFYNVEQIGKRVNSTISENLQHLNYIVPKINENRTLKLN